MSNIFTRTELIYGSEAMQKLSASRVAVFGAGGVGGYVIEALVRSGIGAIDIIDDDVVCESNINRQIIATQDTIGMSKTEVARLRALSINPDIKIYTHNTFFTPENSSEFDFSLYDYVVDAIDTVTGKIELVMKCKEAGTPIISSMGAGNKIYPHLFEVSDIYKTSVCPLARVMRNELKKRGVKKLKVVYSKEKAITPKPDNSADEGSLHIRKRQTPGSTAFVPSVAGLIIAGEVINDITGMKNF